MVAPCRHLLALPFVLTAILTAARPVAPQASFPPPPTAEEATEVRAALQAMKADERGPYARIRWYCADGSVLAPQGTPCRERGGGVQHAEHSALANRLARLGYHVGTILQATPYEAFADAENAGYRLRELVLERYLFDVDDGWVLRRARYYRGALQIEDEEKKGRELLARRFADPEWVRANYLLASQLVIGVPHVRLGGDRATERTRALATEVADLDPGFLRIRIKIHSVPGREDIESVASYLASKSHPAPVREKLVQLRDELGRQYDPARALASLAAYERRLSRLLGPELERTRTALESGDPEAAFREVVNLSGRVRTTVEETRDGGVTLDLLDLASSLQERAFVLARDLEERTLSGPRQAALDRLGQYLTLAWSAGLISGREHAAAQGELRALRNRTNLTALGYKSSLGYLGRSLDWARGSVRGTFAPVLDRYLPVEPAAAGLPDAMLRASVLLPMSRVLDAVEADADAVLGTSHAILGNSVGHGVRGLNPGVARRTLRILDPAHVDEVDDRTIYVLTETPPELKPVAGVLTLDEGNLLSHVQLLARNLGLPNATLSPSLLPRLREVDGREVFYAVSPMGRVVLKRPEQMDATDRGLLEAGQPAQVERYRLDTSRLRLDRTDPIPLSELRSAQSGITVGPKAANLGQLAADFPGRVSRGVALPFGMFHQHVDRPYGAGSRTVLQELQAAYARARAMRAGGASEAEIDAFMLERLTWVREAIMGLEWRPEARRQVVDALNATLGGDVSKGVFVRSDTNVEDLPQFSGAGLNLTVAHQTSVDDVLASVKRVWTSPFGERAYLWRKQILEEQGQVYPSVLLLESVPSAKSGVLITTGLQGGDAGDLTVVTAEGVGGAVEGEDAETLLVRPNGTTRLLSQAKAPRRRVLTRGGTRWVAAARPDTLLQPGELEQLRQVVATWKGKQRGADREQVWDIEFGFLDGRLWLFQIRPFIRFRNSDLNDRLARLDATSLRNGSRPVRLSEPLEGS